MLRHSVGRCLADMKRVGTLEVGEEALRESGGTLSPVVLHATEEARMPLAHLVVVVPGIGGSNLRSPDGELVWGHNVGATVISPFRPEALAIDKAVEPTGLLRIFGVFPWSAVASYDRLTRQVKQRLGLRESDVTVAGPAGVQNPSASLVEFPYDFRHGMARSAERLKDVIDAVRGDRRVIVVAHSMGGLVARWWWGVLDGHRVCDGLITIGTPHRGAPQALDWLLNGVRLGPRGTGPLTSALFSEASEVLRGWPAMYELLPRYQAIKTGVGRVYPHDLKEVSPGFRHLANEAYQRHLQLEEACREGASRSPGSAFMAFYSSGHATPSCAITTNGRVEVTERDPSWLPTQGWKGGDGTVPAISATPVDRESENERCWAPQHHLKLAAAEQVVRSLAQFEQPSLSSVRGTEGPAGPWIGLAYDDVVAAGNPSSVGFRLNGATPSESITPTATIRLAPNRAVPLEIAVGAEGGWRASLPGLAPGSYEFTVALDHVEAVDRVEATSVVGVIEP